MYRILAEEADYIVILKFSDVHFHSRENAPGLVAALRQDTGLDLYPVHRLDTVTSGILLFAKSKKAARYLSARFRDRDVQKYYVALARGKPKKKKGWVIGDMARSRRRQYKLLHSKNNPAVTQFFSFSVAPGIRLFLLKPLSGKTHQLRVAMASLGTPVLGDLLYGGGPADRAYLHAWQLAFEYRGRQRVYRADPEEGDWFAESVIGPVLERCTPPSQLPWPGSIKAGDDVR